MDFRFPEKVRNVFGFLSTEYSFRCVAENSYNVRYESSAVYVVINFDGTRSYELDVGFGLLAESNKPAYSLAELLRYHDAQSQEDCGFAQVTTPELLQRFLDVFSDQLARYGQKVLVGDEQEFRQLSGQRDKECSQYANDSKMRQVRTALTAVWADRDYRQVIRLLDPVVDMLSDAEKKKLHYAKSHL